MAGRRRPRKSGVNSGAGQRIRPQTGGPGVEARARRLGFGSRPRGKGKDGQNTSHEMGRQRFPPSSYKTTIGQLIDWDPWKAPTLRRKQQFGQHSGLKEHRPHPWPKPGLDLAVPPPWHWAAGWDSGPWHYGTSGR